MAFSSKPLFQAPRQVLHGIHRCFLDIKGLDKCGGYTALFCHCQPGQPVFAHSKTFLARKAPECLKECGVRPWTSGKGSQGLLTQSVHASRRLGRHRIFGNDNGETTRCHKTCIVSTQGCLAMQNTVFSYELCPYTLGHFQGKLRRIKQVWNHCPGL